MSFDNTTSGSEHVHVMETSTCSSRTRTGTPGLVTRGYGSEGGLNKGVRARFDWYQATVLRADPNRLARDLADEYEWSEIEPASPRHGYRYAVQIVRGTTIATVMWGGDTQGTGVHVIASGDRAHGVAIWLRTKYPLHHVTRMDAALDLDRASVDTPTHLIGGVGPTCDLFDQLEVAVRSEAINRRMETSFQRYSSGLDGELGRTLYLGSPASRMRLRVYEKGKKDDPDRRPNWVRIEAQYRPKKRHHKEAAATMAPDQVFAVSKWTNAIWSVATGRFQDDIVLGDSNVTKREDVDALIWVLQTYRKRFVAAARVDPLCAQLLDVVEEIDATLAEASR